MNITGRDLEIVESALASYWVKAMGRKMDLEESGVTDDAATWQGIQDETRRILDAVEAAVSDARTAARA